MNQKLDKERIHMSPRYHSGKKLLLIACLFFLTNRSEVLGVDPVVELNNAIIEANNGTGSSTIPLPPSFTYSEKLAPFSVDRFLKPIPSPTLITLEGGGNTLTSSGERGFLYVGRVALRQK